MNKLVLIIIVWEYIRVVFSQFIIKILGCAREQCRCRCVVHKATRDICSSVGYLCGHVSVVVIVRIVWGRRCWCSSRFERGQDLLHALIAIDHSHSSVDELIYCSIRHVWHRHIAQHIRYGFRVVEGSKLVAELDQDRSDEAHVELG